VFVDEFTCIGCRNVSAALQGIQLSQQQSAVLAALVASPADVIRGQATVSAAALPSVCS
jgi:hypothetical protein